jgi:peptide/nickel transport system substrate-binding protein
VFAGGEKETGAAEAVVAADGNEAPMLAERVAAGELPPVEERLPDEPLVVEVVEELGRYGGTWRRAGLGRADVGGFAPPLLESLGRYDQEGALHPSLATGWEFGDGGREVTVFLREGIKWSDGEPFTADDCVFGWDDIQLNESIYPVPGSRMMSGGEPGQITKVDDYTFKISFQEPYGLIIDAYAVAWNRFPYAPKHYLSQFHADYVDKAELDQKVSDAGLDTWMDLLQSEYDQWNNPDLPSVDAFVPINTAEEPIHTLVRNPYYWKVDPEGRQLPYIDRIEQTLMSDVEAIRLKAIAGEIDFQKRRIQSARLYPTALQNQERGDYRIIDGLNRGHNLGSIYLNFWHEDEVTRELLRNKEFRQALSIAIDREELSELFFNGWAPGAQLSPLPYAVGYVEEYMKRYTEYDPDRANQMLDELGLEWDRNNEYRLRPDGQRLRFENIAFIPWPPQNAEMQEIIGTKYFKEIGIQVVTKPTQGSLWNERVDANLHEIASYSSGIRTSIEQTPLDWAVFPKNSDLWAGAWFTWLLTNGREGEEPPAPVKELDTIHEDLRKEPDAAVRERMIKRAFDIFTENLYLIGVVQEPEEETWFVCTNRFRNVPERIRGDGQYSYWSAQFFIEQ